MPLYTFFLEYDGGTYISQVEAKDNFSAPEIWAKQFRLPEIFDYKEFFEDGFAEKLTQSLDLKLISAIEGLKNTWAFTAYKLERPATIHFTQTAV